MDGTGQLPTRLGCGMAALAAVVSIAACGHQKSSSTTSPPPTTTAPSSMTTTVASPSTAPHATSTVMFEVTGTGQALTIDTDPADPSGQGRWYDAALPWQHPAPVASDVSLLQ